MVPIITYHSIGTLNPVLDTPTERFEQHLKAFFERGYKTITVSNLVQLMKAGTPLPEKTFVITFDDGYRTFYTDAWALLKRYGFNATVFLITDFCGKDNQWIGQPASVPRAPLMTWDEIEELASQGCEFGGHTQTHRPLSTLSPQSLQEELVKSRAKIEEITGQSAAIFAYPYGDTSGDAIAAVQEHYEGAVSTDLGICKKNSNKYLLPRIDSYYLTDEWIANLEQPWFSPYLGFRQMLRRVKRIFQPDWTPDEYRNADKN
ncbi:MAG TPA: polysaccharide deacetylase family protein [Drouetiella sp.]|jgi:peptidoglycan/xylan/chitin deacetylase (PgdA/CDA1 family)